MTTFILIVGLDRSSRWRSPSSSGRSSRPGGRSQEVVDQIGAYGFRGFVSRDEPRRVR